MGGWKVGRVAGVIEAPTNARVLHEGLLVLCLLQCVGVRQCCERKGQHLGLGLQRFVTMRDLSVRGRRDKVSNTRNGMGWRVGKVWGPMKML